MQHVRAGAERGIVPAHEACFVSSGSADNTY